MPDLRIRIKKKADGASALSGERADGSVTWQRQDGQQGRFFPPHDLTHFAVETTLGVDRAFYGLLADGWDLSAFADPTARADLPEEATLVELIVGFFDLERATGFVQSADELNDRIRTYLDDRGLPATDLILTQAQVERIRTVRGDLLARWSALPPGDALELDFDRRPTTTLATTRATERAGTQTRK